MTKKGSRAEILSHSQSSESHRRGSVVRFPRSSGGQRRGAGQSVSLPAQKPYQKLVPGVLIPAEHEIQTLRSNDLHTLVKQNHQHLKRILGERQSGIPFVGVHCVSEADLELVLSNRPGVRAKLFVLRQEISEVDQWLRDLLLLVETALRSLEESNRRHPITGLLVANVEKHKRERLVWNVDLGRGVPTFQLPAASLLQDPYDPNSNSYVATLRTELSLNQILGIIPREFHAHLEPEPSTGDKEIALLKHQLLTQAVLEKIICASTNQDLNDKSQPV